MAVPDDGMLPFDGMFPALIQWLVDVPPGQTLPGETELVQLSVAHPRAEELSALLGPHLDAPMVRFVTDPRPGLRAELRMGSGRRMLQ